MIYGGDGLARLPADERGPGKAVFLPFVLAGEEVEAAITEVKPGYARARAETIDGASAHRVPPGRAADPRHTPVRDAMTRNVLCVAEDQSLAEVTSLLANKPVAGVPVVRDGALRGFLTRAEIVRKLLG